jgi:hypothetical protein
MATAKSVTDDQLVDRVRTVLKRVPGVKERRMFGSLGFMVGGKLCVSARPTRLLCRIDPATHGAAIERKGVRTMVMKGRQYRGYVFVDPAVLRTEKALRFWVDQALAFNRTLTKTAAR